MECKIGLSIPIGSNQKTHAYSICNAYVHLFVTGHTLFLEFVSREEGGSNMGNIEFEIR